MGYNFLDILIKKRNGEKLDASEIESLINDYTAGLIPDYQFAAFLMAVYFQGMDFEETTFLTKAMLQSGSILDLSDIKLPKIDKHSTGGVGDKISLILTPLVASCGICIPMISGRSLGHTGGTLDKLEAIPKFRTDLSLTEFKKQLKTINAGFIGQTQEIAPADRLIYSLRDVTATVESIPLITASIMSKKLAENLDGLVLDVKFGNGAFMKDYKKAKQLAHYLVQTGKKFGVKTIAVLTDMNDPLGAYVGNALEVMEAIECLKGKGPPDLMELTFTLALLMLKLAEAKGGTRLLKEKIVRGEALRKFKEIIIAQGGDAQVIEDYGRLPIAQKRRLFHAQKSGYIQRIDTQKLGILATKLGAGRLKKEDQIDPGCGFRIYKKTGARVDKGEPLVEIFSDDKQKAEAILNELPSVFLIGKKPNYRYLIRAIIR
ncbi:MAG: thymidine phosphorylase [candidate division WOR-3 bacterium]